MKSERFGNSGGAEKLAPEELVERFKNAFAEENIQELSVCIAQLQLAMENGKDSGDALSAYVKQLRTIVEYHKDLLRVWAEEDPRLREGMRELIVGLAQLFDLDIDLEEG